MLIAAKNDGQPFTLAVMGANFTFTPITRPMIMRARRAARPVLADAAGGEDALDEFGSAVSQSLITEGLIGWEGVALPLAEGEECEAPIEVEGVRYRQLDCTPENKALLLADAVIFDALDTAYVAPFVTRERAKNAPAGSSDGISSRVMPAPITAGSPAPAKSAAKPAPTGKARSKTKKSS